MKNLRELPALIAQSKAKAVEEKAAALATARRIHKEERRRRLTSLKPYFDRIPQLVYTASQKDKKYAVIYEPTKHEVDSQENGDQYPVKDSDLAVICETLTGMKLKWEIALEPRTHVNEDNTMREYYEYQLRLFF